MMKEIERFSPMKFWGLYIGKIGQIRALLGFPSDAGKKWLEARRKEKVQ